MSCRILRRRACMSSLPRCFKFTDVYVSSSSGGNVSSSGSCTPREEVITLGKSAVCCKYLQHRKIIQIASAENRSTCVFLSRACMSPPQQCSQTRNVYISSASGCNVSSSVITAQYMWAELVCHHFHIAGFKFTEAQCLHFIYLWLQCHLFHFATITMGVIKEYFHFEHSNRAWK